jgi:hypothetical protein
MQLTAWGPVTGNLTTNPSGRAQVPACAFLFTPNTPSILRSHAEQIIQETIII